MIHYKFHITTTPLPNKNTLLFSYKHMKFRNQAGYAQQFTILRLALCLAYANFLRYRYREKLTPRF